MIPERSGVKRKTVKGAEMSEKPIFIVTDDLVDCGAAVVKSVFPDATDEQCCTAAAGAFMSMLTEFEDGNLSFAYSEEGPFFTFGKRSIQ